MIQITSWIELNEKVWHKGKPVPAFVWLEKLKVKLEKLTHKKCEIRTDKGKVALFRERLR
tara:strand:+ start:384 stop:563 length:180 start_codon:yes stop_codon:yes gene_type:complete